MPSEQQHEPVRSRNEHFAQRTVTKIWSEEPSEDNPYAAKAALCYGYDLFELMEKRSFVDVFYLLFRGELPTKSDSEILEKLMVALINPGPRHPATRAAMNAGVGKTNPLHILPIASAVMGGDYMGGGDVENAMRFLRKNQKNSTYEFDPTQSCNRTDGSAETSDPFNATPGFGKRYGGIDPMAKEIARRLSKMDGAGPALAWGNILATKLAPYNAGWLVTGISAAIFADLGFQPRAGGSLFQILATPGLVAHGLEMSNKPITAMPFVNDENYVIER